MAKKKNRTGRIRTCNQGIMLTDYDFRRPFRVCGLDHTFIKLKKISTLFDTRCLPSGLYTFCVENNESKCESSKQLGSGLT
jgi:hypothetical protein